QGDPAPKLGDRGDADKGPVLVEPVEPGQHLWLRRRPPHLRQHIGVDEDVHRSRSRGWSRRRSRSMSAPRRGEASRNSARVPLRSALRAHSSAETMTALGLPCRVMICGSVWARSITSDSLALASATVQLSEALGDDVLAAVIVLSFDYSNQYDYRRRPA